MIATAILSRKQPQIAAIVCTGCGITKRESGSAGKVLNKNELYIEIAGASGGGGIRIAGVRTAEGIAQVGIARRHVDRRGKRIVGLQRYIAGAVDLSPIDDNKVRSPAARNKSTRRFLDRATAIGS